MTSASDERAYSRYDQYGDNPMAPVGPIGLIALRGSEDFTTMSGIFCGGKTNY